MKKLLSALLVVLMVVSVVGGCSTSESAEVNPEDDTAAVEPIDEEPLEEPETALKVALILPGSINDAGWSASAYEGLVKIEEEYGAEISYTENTSMSDQDGVFRLYAEGGFDIIFAHGNEYADGATRIAPDYPDIQFCITASDVVQEPNISSLNTDNAEMGFLTGVVAAVASENQVVGMIGGMDIPAIADSVKGFEVGAKYINMDIEVLSSYIGNFDDGVHAKEVANSMIEMGADVLMHDAGPAGNGVIEACIDGDVYAIGAISDQSALAPETVIVSGIADMPSAFKAFVDLYYTDGFSPASVALGAQEDTVYLMTHDVYDSALSDEQKATVDQVISDLMDGSLDIRTLGEFNL
jgi:basic membrane protein A